MVDSSRPPPDLKNAGTVLLQMTTRRQFGFSNRARLNPALLVALGVSGDGCETCRDIERDIEHHPDGGEFVESPSMPARSVQALDAHFKYHWKSGYELVDLVNRSSAR